MPQTELFHVSKPPPLVPFFLQTEQNSILLYDSYLGNWLYDPWTLSWLQPSCLTLVSKPHLYSHISWVLPYLFLSTFPPLLLLSLCTEVLSFPKILFLSLSFSIYFFKVFKCSCLSSLLDKLLFIFQTWLDISFFEDPFLVFISCSFHSTLYKPLV